ncbi:MAG: hypothetical protein WCO84_02205 [bacterium]
MFIASWILVLVVLVCVVYKIGDKITEWSNPESDPRFFCAIPAFGWVVVITLNENGPAIMFLGMSNDEFYLDPDTGILHEKAKNPKEKYEGPIAWFLRVFLGVAWIGLYGRVMKEEFDFNEIKDGVLKARAINTPYTKIQGTYSEWLTDMTTSDMFQMKLLCQIIIRVRNVQKLRLLVGKGWLKDFFGSVNATVKDWVVSLPYDSVMKEKTETTNSEFLKSIKALDDAGVGNKTLLELYGLEIVGASLVDVKPMDEVMFRATTKKFVAEKEGEGSKAEAKIKAEIFDIETIAKAKSITDLAIAKKVEGLAQVEVDKARVKAYGGTPPEIAAAKGFGETHGTFVNLDLSKLAEMFKEKK